MSKCTSTPWKVERTAPDENGPAIYWIMGGDGLNVVTKIIGGGSEPALANAMQIVKAVNGHESLVKACQNAASFLFQEIEAVINDELKTEYQGVIDELQQALLKAESEI